MKFTQTGGYTGFNPNYDQSSAELNSLNTGTIEPNFANDFTFFCAAHRVDYVLIGLGAPLALAAALIAEGWPESIHQGIIVIELPPAEALNYYGTTGDYWPSVLPQKWMGRGMQVFTHGSPMLLTLTSTNLIHGAGQIIVTCGTSKNVYLIGQSPA